MNKLYTLLSSIFVALSFSFIVFYKNLPAPAIELKANSSQVNCCTFLAAGRQGYGNDHTSNIAESMANTAKAEKINAVFLLGDNFYPRGVKSVEDPQWNSKFENLYRGESLLNMPFYAVLGNHDHQGNPRAQINYDLLNVGSGRWNMASSYYVKDFGDRSSPVNARVVFLDSISLHRKGTRASSTRNFLSDTEDQLAFIEAAFSKENENVDAKTWKIVVSHYPFKSNTVNPYSKSRIMSQYLPLLERLNVDLVISSNDRFQQILSTDSGVMHVSANGGGEKLDVFDNEDEIQSLLISRRGFSKIEINSEQLKVTLLDENGEASFVRVKNK